MLTARDIHKSYFEVTRSTPVLRGVSLTLEPGSSLALMGDSGSGKSTLLHLIGGLDLPDQGEISLNGTAVNQSSDSARAALRLGQIGIIFQQFNLIPSLTIAANIAFQARLADRYDAGYCAELAAHMGLSDHLAKYPEALSGGQQQRVAIARALAARPALLLADEPTGNLDEGTADSVLSLLLERARAGQQALLMVTHSARHAARLDRQLTLSSGRIL